MYQKSCQAENKNYNTAQSVDLLLAVEEVAKVAEIKTPSAKWLLVLWREPLNKFLRSNETILGGYGIEFCISLILKI